MNLTRDILGVIGFLALCIGVGIGYGWYNGIILGGAIIWVAAIAASWNRPNKQEKK